MSIDCQFLYCGAPAICGIKPANLFSFSINKWQSESFKVRTCIKEIKEIGLQVRVIKCTNNRVLVFFYTKKLIKKILQKKDVAEFLKNKGYKNPSLFIETLERLFFRLKNSNDFPHEIGLFLGYPLNDVIAFEERNGMEYKFCDYWKVYHNEEEARLICNKYRECSKFCGYWRAQGICVNQIINKYKLYATA